VESVPAAVLRKLLTVHGAIVPEPATGLAAPDP